METTTAWARAIEVMPSGEALGAEIRGVDVASGMGDAEVERIKDAWREHPVLMFRDQSIDDAQLVAFARRFGELDPPGPNPYGGPIYPEHSELNIISNIVEDGRPIGNLSAGEAV